MLCQALCWQMNIHATNEDQSEVKVRVMLTTEQKQHSGQEEQQVGSCQHTDEAQHSSDKQHDHTERQQDDERSLHVWKEKRSGCVSASHNPSRFMQIFSLVSPVFVMQIGLIWKSLLLCLAQQTITAWPLDQFRKICVFLGVWKKLLWHWKCLVYSFWMVISKANQHHFKALCNDVCSPLCDERHCMKLPFVPEFPQMHLAAGTFLTVLMLGY